MTEVSPAARWEGCKYQSTYTPTLELVSAEAAGLKTAQVRAPPTTRTILRQDGPNRLGLW